MSETDHAEGHAGHGPTMMSYLVVGIALSIFTAVSFGVNYMVQHRGLATETGFALILGVAIVKASLVGAYFMHLKFDWRLVYFMLIPAFILGTMMMIVLLPDIVLAWRQ
jgi:cytochrome c oxidase subunit 4